MVFLKNVPSFLEQFRNYDDLSFFDILLNSSKRRKFLNPESIAVPESATIELFQRYSQILFQSIRFKDRLQKYHTAMLVLSYPAIFINQMLLYSAAMFCYI